MKIGWNRRYVFHLLWCKNWLRNSSRLFNLLILMTVLLVAFPGPGASVYSSDRQETPKMNGKAVNPEQRRSSLDPQIRTMDDFLKRHEVNEANRDRLAESIVSSARKHDLDSRLIASILIVESRGNPFAISGKNAIGIMQVHLPTWGAIADREGVNLLRIEDNVDFGARILKDYVRRFGLWDGVKRYNGFFVNDPVSEQSAQEYVEKVQRVYEFQKPVASRGDVLE